MTPSEMERVADALRATGWVAWDRPRCGMPVPDPHKVTDETICGLRKAHDGDHRTTGTVDGWLYTWPRVR